jgi:hypothetical protein
VKTAAVAAVPPTPAQQAEAAAASADALETQMRLLSGPRYDFGAGSSARNKFFADVSNPRRGLGRRHLRRDHLRPSSSTDSTP